MHTGRAGCSARAVGGGHLQRTRGQGGALRNRRAERAQVDQRHGVDTEQGAAGERELLARKVEPHRLDVGLLEQSGTSPRRPLLDETEEDGATARCVPYRRAHHAKVDGRIGECPAEPCRAARPGRPAAKGDLAAPPLDKLVQAAVALGTLVIHVDAPARPHEAIRRESRPAAAIDHEEGRTGVHHSAKALVVDRVLRQKGSWHACELHDDRWWLVSLWPCAS